MKTSAWLFALVLLACFSLFVAACDHGAGVVQPVRSLTPAQIVDCDGTPVDGAPWRRAFGIDGEYARLAERVPGFGGLFLDGDEIVVYLVDLSTKEEARPIIEEFVARSSISDREIRWLTGRFDWRQLVVWKMCLSDRLFALDGMTSSDISESENRIVFGVEDEGLIPRAEEEVARTAVPAEAVRFEKQGPICTQPLIPSIVAEVRDARGDPIAIGATVTISKPGLQAVDEGFADPLRVAVAANNEGGVYDVRVTKPWYADALIAQVDVPAGECGVREPEVVEAVLSLRSDAPAVRQVVLPPTGYGFGSSVCGTRHPVPAYVLTAEGTSREMTWVSRDPGRVKVEAGESSPDGSNVGWIIPQCGATSGDTRVVGMAKADPSVRDSVEVSVF